MEQLSQVLREPSDLTHEQVLNSILILVKQSEIARQDALVGELGLEQILKEKILDMSGQEEYNESVEYCRQLLSLCFREADTADR